jgi:hypothetical protein
MFPDAATRSESPSINFIARSASILWGYFFFKARMSKVTGQPSLVCFSLTATQLLEMGTWFVPLHSLQWRNRHWISPSILSFSIPTYIIECFFYLSRTSTARSLQVRLHTRVSYTVVSIIPT